MTMGLVVSSHLSQVLQYLSHVLQYLSHVLQYLSCGLEHAVHMKMRSPRPGGAVVVSELWTVQVYHITDRVPC